MNKLNASRKGFTLIELLVVISIIAFMVAVAVVAYTSARSRSRTTKAQSDIKQIVTSVQQLEIETNKWPGGCTIGATSAASFAIDTAAAAIIQTPVAGTTVSPCAWTSTEVTAWKGPYITLPSLNDPWGNPYYFVHGYTSGSQTFAAVVSWGPDKVVGTPNSDDIYTKLR